MSVPELRPFTHTLSLNNQLMTYYVESIESPPVPNKLYFHDLGFDSVNGILTNERKVWWSRFSGDASRSHNFLAEAAGVEDIGYLGQFEIHRGARKLPFYQVYAYKIEDIEALLQFSFQRSDYHPDCVLEFAITPSV